MKTALATAPRPQNTWDEAADTALETILGEFRSVAITDPASVVTYLEANLGTLVKHSFHADADPTEQFTSLACYARDALVDMGAMPTIEQITNLLADKQANYGTGNILAFGVKGIIIRVSDKVARIGNMIANARQDEGEPLEDAFLDIIGYATIARMLAEGTFVLPLARDLPTPDLDECLEMAFDSTEHVDMVAFVRGISTVDSEINDMLTELVALAVENGRRIPPVISIYRA